MKLYHDTTKLAPDTADNNAQKETDDDWYNEYITNDEVTGTLRRMRSKKAVGPDRVEIDVLKDNDVLHPLMTRMFNLILDSERIPQDWRIAHVKPLFEGRDSPDEAKNYLPLIAISCFPSQEASRRISCGMR